MTSSTTIRTYFALTVSLDSFFLATEHVQCSADTRHQIDGDAAFCPHCGSAALSWQPTQAFESLCAANDTTPLEAFTQLQTTGWDWYPDESREVTYAFKWLQVQLKEGIEPATCAIGFELHTISVEDHAAYTLSYRPNGLTHLSKAIADIAAALGILGSPKIYIQVSP